MRNDTPRFRFRFVSNGISGFVVREAGVSDVDDLGVVPMPDPVALAQWAGLARTLIAALAGAGILGGAWAAVSAEQIANLLTAFLTVGGALTTAGVALWSMWQKRAARRAEVAAAVASVAKGVPVTVVETPKGQPNVVKLIPRAEVAAAPVVPVGPPSPAPRAA